MEKEADDSPLPSLLFREAYRLRKCLLQKMQNVFPRISGCICILLGAAAVHGDTGGRNVWVANHVTCLRIVQVLVWMGEVRLP